MRAPIAEVPAQCDSCGRRRVVLLSVTVTVALVRASLWLCARCRRRWVGTWRADV